MTLKSTLLFILIACWHLSSAQYVIRIAGNDSFGYQGDGGPAINASVYSPYGVCRDKSGNLYFADDLWGLDCCGYGRIRKVNAATGIISTIAGGSSATATGNNIPAVTAFVFPFTLRIDTTGNIYMVEGGSEVRMINHATGIISVVAGIADTGYSGDGGPATAAKLYIQDIALDAAGNLYIADCGYNVIRKVNAANGIITTIAGNGTTGFSGDGGPAMGASFNNITGVYVDNNDNIYISDFYNFRIRMVNAATGIITTIAGNGTNSENGDGGPATAAAIPGPLQLITDDQGNLFFTEYESNRIRKVEAVTHVISTYAGSGAEPYTVDSLGDGGPATSAIISPWGMCFDTCGDMYFSDYVSSIRAVVPQLSGQGTLCNYFITNSVPDIPSGDEGMKLYPNPTQGVVTIKVYANVTEPVDITITDLLGQKVKELSATTNLPVEVLLNVPPGIYFVEAITAENKWREKVVKQ